MVKHIYLVRHGQTYLNKYFRIQGWSDAPLTDKGVADAKRAGDRLAHLTFAAVYSSDAPRAQRTARFILAANQHTTLTDPIIEPAFREENFGYFEGNDDVQAWHVIGGPHGQTTFNQMIAETSIEATKNAIHAADPYGDAEDNATFWGRLQPGLDRVIAAANDGDNILITSHGTTIRSIVSRYSDIPVDVSAENGSVTRLSVDLQNQITVDYYNDVDGNID